MYIKFSRAGLHSRYQRGSYNENFRYQLPTFIFYFICHEKGKLKTFSKNNLNWNPFWTHKSQTTLLLQTFLDLAKWPMKESSVLYPSSKIFQDFLIQDKCFQFPSFLARFIVGHFPDQLWNSPTVPQTTPLMRKTFIYPSTMIQDKKYLVSPGLKNKSFNFPSFPKKY